MRRLAAIFVMTLVAFAPATVVAQGDDVRHALRYLVGSGMTEGIPGVLGPATPHSLCNWATPLGPTCPNEAMASNGDTVKFQGEGILYLNARGRPSRHITGGGSFVHLTSSGDVVATGTWTAKRLLSFVSWGPATEAPLPQRFTAGTAQILVDLVSDTGDKLSGTLEVVCRLPGDAGPAGGPGEGSRLNIHDVLDFDTSIIPRATLFIDLAVP